MRTKRDIGMVILLIAAGVLGGIFLPTFAKEKTKPAAKTGNEATLFANATPSHIHQRADFCGEASLAMWLQAKGQNVTQDDVFALTGVNPTAGRGCYAPELYRAILAAGLNPGTKGNCWKTVPATQAKKQLNVLFTEMIADLKKGIPSIVCMRYNERPNTTEHFRLFHGYNPNTQQLLYFETATKKSSVQTMSKKRFLSLWPLKSRKDRWTVIRFALKPGKKATRHKPTPTSVTPTLVGPGGKKNKVVVPTFSDADYAQHVRKLKATPPIKGLTYVVEKPFVVASDEGPARANAYARGTVRWATLAFKKAYFKNDPAHIITIYLLGSKKSYRAVAKAISNDPPDTPYGYFSQHARAMVMNIRTGGGTLVHEMFHAFVPANFPEMPSWLNEGMGSLYEQSGKRNRQIVGFTNWRLAGLQKAIRAKTTVPLKKLTSTTTAEFYGRGSGTHYAMARYLCYYLQQKGKLRAFYRDFQKNHATDPTGYQTLVKALGSPDMTRFQASWEAWCLTLRFPPSR